MSPLEFPARIPPHNLDAERAVLGAILLEGRETLPRVIEVLRPSDFYTEAHRAMYATMLRLFDRGEPVDLITLSEELRRAAQLEFVGGPAALAAQAARPRQRDRVPAARPQALRAPASGLHQHRGPAEHGEGPASGREDQDAHRVEAHGRSAARRQARVRARPALGRERALSAGSAPSVPRDVLRRALDGVLRRAPVARSLPRLARAAAADDEACGGDAGEEALPASALDRCADRRRW